MENKNEITSCTEEGWASNNIDAYSWYMENYPVLKNFNLPMPYEFLKNFYIADMELRNLVPIVQFYSCYEYVLSYFLENFEKPLSEKFQGKTWLGYLADSFPGALKKSFTDINNDVFKRLGNLFTFFTSPYVLVVLIIVIIYILKKVK